MKRVHRDVPIAIAHSLHPVRCTFEICRALQVKTGERQVKHVRYYRLMLAEGHLTRGRFAAMLRRIAMLPLPAS